MEAWYVHEDSAQQITVTATKWAETNTKLWSSK